MALWPGIESKLERARQHHSQLLDEVHQLLVGYEGAAVRAEPLRGDEHVYVLKGAPSVPAHWTALVGDIVHNLRSALDHLAWQLVLASGGSPRRERPATAFPVYDEPSSSPVAIRGGLREDLRQMVEDEQPYVRFPESPRKCPLFLVRELNNIDKHVDIVPVVAVLGAASWSVPEGVEVTFRPTRIDLSDGTEIGRFTLYPEHLDDIGPSFEFQVRARPPLPFPELQAGDLCGWALGVATHSYIPELVRRFEVACA